jgi:hypothetical protein
LSVVHWDVQTVVKKAGPWETSSAVLLAESLAVCWVGLSGAPMVALMAAWSAESLAAYLVGLSDDLTAAQSADNLAAQWAD